MAITLGSKPTLAPEQRQSVFSIIADVDPRLGLFASFTMAVTIAFLMRERMAGKLGGGH
ncbi:hypothetical protein [Arthrobacter sp. Soil782]|uniref:hypothetical protein n=1 Tax=Arthrobacter sp. Soil782 TaxID=1736410 RepID=UPI000A92A2AB|nr:hypothetical protein [Arthrobacter sp. Soil782]